jgi:hypothetical protein
MELVQSLWPASRVESGGWRSLRIIERGQHVGRYTEMEKFKIQGYFDFLENTKPGSMLVKEVLEESNILLVHANSGTSKTSAWGYELAASILADKPYLGRFEILAKNVYIFFVSQDAPAHDVVRHSQKVFRRHFDFSDPRVRDELNKRFNVLDYEGILLGKDSPDAQALVESIRQRLQEVLPQAPSFRDISSKQLEAAKACLRTVQELPPVVPDDEPLDEPKVLVLWDSLRKLHDGKESASDELKPVIDGLRYVNRELDATSVLFHHNNRSGTIRGDASIEDAVDQSYHIKRRKGCKPTDPVQHFDLLVDKPRGIPVQPFIYRMAREDVHTKAEVIRFEYVRELPSEEADAKLKQGRDKTTKDTGANPKLEAARREWTEGMSIRALAKKIKVGRIKAKELIEELQAERALRAG